MQTKIAVITGASSGIGRETAALLVERAYTVYDFSRTEKPQPGVTHVYCDVTKPETIREAFQQVAAREEHLDLLILCAGMGVAGSIEHTADDEMQRQFDVNTFGPVRVLQAALPLMRNHADSKGECGRIVFVSSMAAIFGIPFQAMYSATKAAVNSFAFSLRNELRQHHIGVSVVMPGDVKTNFKRHTNLEGQDIYPNMHLAIGQMERDEANGLSAHRVALRVLKAATTRKPKLYYTSDPMSTLQCVLQKLLPTSVALYVVRKLYHC